MAPTSHLVRLRREEIVFEERGDSVCPEKHEGDEDEESRKEGTATPAAGQPKGEEKIF